MSEEEIARLEAEVARLNAEVERWQRECLAAIEERRQAVRELEQWKAAHPAGLRPVGRPPKYADAYAWDWTKPDVDLAREHQVEINQVRNIRRRLGKPPVAAPGGRERGDAVRRKWGWSKKDAELATIHGISRERVRQVRDRLGLPPSSGSPGWTETEQKFLAWVNGHESISFLEAKHAGFHQASVTKWCKKHSIRREIYPKSGPRRSPDWERMNWALPNWALEEIWGKSQSKVRTYRCDRGLPSPPPRVQRQRVTPELQALIEAEREDAKAQRRNLNALRLGDIVLPSVRIFARREDFGARAVPARSTPARR